MYIKDGIAYAGEQETSITVLSVRALEDHKLWIRFSTGETKIFDFAPLLNAAVFKPLIDKELFNVVYIDYGVPVWDGGTIDIAPEHLYQNGIYA